MKRSKKAEEIAPAEFFHQDNRVKKVSSHATVFFRDLHAQETLLAHFFPDASGYDPGLFPFFNVRNHFSVKEFSQSFPENPVFL
jgi:hypothetical protein